MKTIKKEFQNYVLLMRSIPALVLTLFVVSICVMNILANKSLNLPFSWMALDAGITVSWLSFLTMDILVRRFGPKAATLVSITASAVNIIVCVIYYVASLLPGVWGESFVPVGGEIINIALDNTIGGTWFIIFGSTCAFIAGAIVNNFSNAAIGKVLTNDTFHHYAVRSYVSTFLGQFIDNLTFALIVSLSFFGWTLTQCFVCAVTGAIVELLFEIVFSPLGYRVCKNWSKHGVGNQYLDTVATAAVVTD